MRAALAGGADGLGGGAVSGRTRASGWHAAHFLAVVIACSLGMARFAHGADLVARVSGGAQFPGETSLAGSTLRRAEGRLEAMFARTSTTYPPQTVTLVGLKREGRLELWARGRAETGWTFVHSYWVRVASGRLGPKLRQGDHQVPEGMYRVTGLNPNSRFHLSLRLDYPNEFDRAQAAAEGRRRLGGDIMIHGGAASVGCLAVGDEAAEDLFALAERIGPQNLSVIMSPVDLRAIGLDVAIKHAASPMPWLRALYAQIARELQPFPLPSYARVPTGSAKLAARRASCKPYDARDCRRRCEKGEAASCARAGLMYRDGRGTVADETLAWAFLVGACVAGDALGCAELSWLHLNDPGRRRDVGRAADLARSACNAGDGHGCAYLAEMCNEKLVYSDIPQACSAESISRLRTRAVTLLAHDCKGWSAYDCATLATIYASGGPATALRFATGACKGGDPGGCYTLAGIAETGADPARASDLYRRACKAGFTIACDRYAFAR